MITKFIIQRRTSSKAWDVREIVSNVKWSTDMNYSAGELDFDMLKQKGFQIYNGDVIKVGWDNKNIFYGFVFKYSLSENNKFSITCYDPLRYLKNPDSIVFQTSTLTQRFNQICKAMNLKHKVISSSSAKLNAAICDNQSYFDMLKDSINTVYRDNGKRYFLADNYGTIELRQFPYKKLNLKIGDKSLVTSYTLDRSIDSAANTVKVMREDNTKKKRETSTKTITRGKNKGQERTTSKTVGETQNNPDNTAYESQNAESSSVDRWGSLVYVDKPNDKLNKAQMKSRAEKLLKQKNKQENSLKLTCLGNSDLVAGNSVNISLYDLKSAGIGNKPFLIESATHHLDDNNYTVDLEMKI